MANEVSAPAQIMRIYPLDPRQLTEEQLAVVFAMTSRRPEPFDEIAKVVTAEKAADFHERWVLNYGHASVAEHAIIHMAVESISRLACDTLEDNRLASYTEKSSRYQVIEPGYYHVPQELSRHVGMRQLYVDTCDALFAAYERLVDGLRAYLPSVRPRQQNERDSAYNLRIRREATDSARFLLPAATLTNVGVTMNARSLEHAIAKLLSSDMEEERSLGEALKEQGRRITPTLIKYAERNDYLVLSREAQRDMALPYAGPRDDSQVEATLVHYDPDAEAKVAAALLYRFAHQPYAQIWKRVHGMSDRERQDVIGRALEGLGPHDAPVRELETVDYTFDLVMDYGAYREFKRHRMQTYIPQPPTVELGYVAPPLVKDAGLQAEFESAIGKAEDAFRTIRAQSPRAAEYLVTHAHRRRVLSKMNLRECYHLFKLRTGPEAHFSIRPVVAAAMREAQKVHPGLFKYLKLRS
ncbi:MAG: FAD-dependent thymidylate synthase [Dehalococcoidia bacterium]|nr:FAD-dependent thymidylate synthase [Dehalococcoidia bacterium]